MAEGRSGVWVELRLVLTIGLIALILWVVPMSTPEGQRLVQVLHAWLDSEDECPPGS